MNKLFSAMRVVTATFFRFSSFRLISCVALVPLFAGITAAAQKNGGLRVELTTAYNFIVDSNVETPATYAPRAAYISARLWNDGSTPITDVRAYIGDRTANTPGIYPSRIHTENPNIVGPLPGGAFAITHEGGSLGTSDASRLLGTIPPGGYIPVYWLVSYPNLDINGKSVTGGIKPNDDLYLFYDIWATGNEGVTPRNVDVRRRVHMRNCISAMANKIFPNTANKVPQEYQDILEKYEPAWNSVPIDGTPGTSVVTEGIWYDLGNVNKGFDNDGNLVPDQNAWLQPVGDPSLFDPSAFRLQRTYALVVVKLKNGGEAVYDVTDQLYFTNLPDNTGVIGLVRYDYLPLKPNTTSTTTPYQMAASGFDNEKFNGDFGTGFGFSSPDTELTLDKNVNLDVANPGDPLNYTIDFNNEGVQAVGNPIGGVPLVVKDSIPAGTTYVANSAGSGNTPPAGMGAYEIFYSTDNGATWSATEPTTASDVTDIQWWLTDELQAGAGGQVTFSVQISNAYPFAGAPVVNVAGLAFGNTVPFLEDDAITFLQGNLNISGTVFEDIGTGTGGIFGDGILNGTEPGIPSVVVSLYYDADGDGIVDAGDILMETTDSSGTGTYLFTNLPDGDYVVQVDRQDSDIPTGYTITNDEEIAVMLSSIDSTGNDFGFAPTLLVTKSGTVSAYPGQPVQYNIQVENRYPNISQTVTYTGYPTATDSNHSPSQNNQRWVNDDDPTVYPATNILGNTPSTYVNALYANATKSIGVTDFNIASQAATITGVQLDLMGMFRDGANFATNEGLQIEVIQKPSTVLASYTINDTELNALTTAPNTNLKPINITAAKTNWAWADFGATSDITIKLTTIRTGNTTTALHVAGTRITLTTNQTISPNTLSAVPLTDTYNANELEFVSATPAPNSTSVVGSVGTLSWNNVGPIAPGDSSSIAVNFTARTLPGISPITTTDTASVTGAQFLNGDPANDGEATADTVILPTASIGDTIFVDANRSGSQDLGESGISGVTVELYQNNVLVGSQVTGSNGDYLFSNLIPGTYEVRVVANAGPLVGWTLSADPDLDGEPFDPLNPDPFGNSRTTRTLAGGEFFSGADFGYVPPGAALSGIAWIDFNDDGIVDENEIGIQYVTVELYDDSNNLIATTLTDSEGAYSFAGLDDGSYRVAVITTPVPDEFPPDLAQTYDPDSTLDNQTVVIIAGADVEDVNFGYRYEGINTLSGTIGMDGDPIDGLLNGTNPSGVASDETAFFGVTVYLYSWNDLNNNDEIDSGEAVLLATTTTNTNGDYSFAGLPASEFYLVSISSPQNNLIITTTSTTPGHPADEVVVSSNSQGYTTGAYAVVPAASEITNVDFAFESAVEYDFGDLPDSYRTLLASNGPRHIIPMTPNLYLGDGVSTEPNGQPSTAADLDTFDDGVFVAGIWQNATGGGTVQVDVVGAGWLVGFVDFNQDGDFQDAGELVANQAVTTGTYTITFNIPAGSLDEIGSTSLYSRFRLLPTQPFIPELAFQGEASNGEVEDYLWNFHSITGTVYIDADNDSGFSSGDITMHGVMVELYDGSNNQIATTVTSMEGFYSFYGLPDGNYMVQMVTPAGGTAILDADGSANGNDQIDVLVSSDTITERDFLLGQDSAYASLSGTAFIDADKNGQFSGGDLQYPGVLVSLYRDLNNDGIASSSEFIGSMPTDSNGGYLFTNLSNGSYLVAITGPSGATAILDVDGAANGNDLIAVTMSGVDVIDQDFLLDLNSSISGTITIDLDGNDIGDVPHVGVAVQLLDENDNVLATTTTDSDGFYIFPIATAGNYKVRQLVPTGYDAVNDFDGGDFDIIGDGALIAVANDDDVTGMDFVNREQPATIGDFVWVDANGNGMQDPGEVGLSGVTVNLLDTASNVVATTVSGSNGEYMFGDLTAGTYRVQFVRPEGYTFTTQNADGQGVDGAANSDPDRGTGITENVVIASGETNLNIDAGMYRQDCPDLWTDWQDKWDVILGGQTGLLDNPDGDRYNNLIEYAFCLPPHLGISKPFCLAPSISVSGAIDGVYSRTAIGGAKDVTYVLEWTAELGAPTTWTGSVVLDETNTTFTDDGNGKETVRIADLETLTGLADAGFVRIRVDLDNGDDQATGHTDVLGWVQTDFAPCCTTYCNPFLECAVFTGTIASVDGQNLVFSTSATNFDLGTLLDPGVVYYIEVESGDLAGHRFDVTGGGLETLTIADDSDLFALAPPFNTVAGAAPALLEGDRIALHVAKTLDQLFPPTGFGASNDRPTSDEVQVYAGGQWKIYWLFDDNGTPRWVDAADGNHLDQGGTVIPPGRGLFFNNRTAATSLLAFGEVREQPFVNPLAAGNNLVGGGYPVDQAPVGANSRELNFADGFFGSRDFKTADSIFRWRADENPASTGYETYFLLSNANPLVLKWVLQNDANRVSQDDAIIFERDRSVFQRVRDGVADYLIPAPWSPDAP